MEHYVSEDDLLEMLVERTVDYASSLPLELLELCLSPLDPIEVIQNVFIVSKRFYKLSRNSILWRRLFEHQFEVESTIDEELSRSLPSSFEPPVEETSKLRVSSEIIKDNVNENINWNEEFKKRFLWHRKFSECKLRQFSSSAGSFSNVSVANGHVAAYDGSDSLTFDLIQVWDVDRVKNKAVSTGHESHPTFVKLTDAFIIVGTSSGEVKVFNLLTKLLHFSLGRPNLNDYIQVSSVDMVGKDFLAVGYSSGHVSFWEVGSSSNPVRDGGHSSSVDIVSISSKVNRVLSISKNEVAVWDSKTGALKHRLVLKSYFKVPADKTIINLVSWSRSGASKYFLLYCILEFNSSWTQNRLLSVDVDNLTVDSYQWNPMLDDGLLWNKYVFSWSTLFQIHPISKTEHRIFYIDMDSMQSVWFQTDILGGVSEFENASDAKVKIFRDVAFVCLDGALIGIWHLKSGQNLLPTHIRLCRNPLNFKDFFPFENGVVVLLNDRLDFYEWEKQHFTPSKTQNVDHLAILPVDDDVGVDLPLGRNVEDPSVDLFDDEDESEEPPFKKRRVDSSDS